MRSQLLLTALMRSAGSDERVMKLLDGKELSVEKIREFTEEETDAALKSILAEKSKGISVRRAIMNVTGADNETGVEIAEQVQKRTEKAAGTNRTGKKGTGTGKCGACKRRSRRRGGKKRCGKR